MTDFWDTQWWGIGFIVAGSVVMLIGARDLGRVFVSTRWPTVRGIVEDSHVETDSDCEMITFSAVVHYRFAVGGKTYMGNRVTLRDLSAGSGTAQEVVNRYPAGRQIVVHYRQSDPNDCVLEPGLNPGVFFVLGVGLFFALAGGLAMLIA